VIEEPLGGAHRDYHQIAQRIKAHLVKSLRELLAISTEELLERRYAKFRRMGAFLDGSSAATA
jgi:acetyl-CoA carboxylase carboxyl transferase subunit alpha